MSTLGDPLIVVFRVQSVEEKRRERASVSSVRYVIYFHFTYAIISDMALCASNYFSGLM